MRRVPSDDLVELRCYDAPLQPSTFIAAAIAEWRKLVVEVLRTFAFKRNHRAVADNGKSDGQVIPFPTGTTDLIIERTETCYEASRTSG